jgi:hypothetical protein
VLLIAGWCAPVGLCAWIVQVLRATGALHAGVRARDLECVQAAVAAGADVNATHGVRAVHPIPTCTLRWWNVCGCSAWTFLTLYK